MTTCFLHIFIISHAEIAVVEHYFINQKFNVAMQLSWGQMFSKEKTKLMHKVPISNASNRLDISETYFHDLIKVFEHVDIFVD